VAMNFLELTEAYIADRRMEHIRDYAVRGRPLAGLSAESLTARWVETYRAVNALEDEDREGELIDLRSEFDLRGIEPPMHLVAAESALVGERLKRQVSEGAADPVEVEQTEAKLADLYARLQGPKN
jgi:hypothetical protein